MVTRRLIGLYVEVFQYPDGRVQIRVASKALAHARYDKLVEVDQGAIVESERLGRVLRMA